MGLSGYETNPRQHALLDFHFYNLQYVVCCAWRWVATVRLGKGPWTRLTGYRDAHCQICSGGGLLRCTNVGILQHHEGYHRACECKQWWWFWQRPRPTAPHVGAAERQLRSFPGAGDVACNTQAGMRAVVVSGRRQTSHILHHEEVRRAPLSHWLLCGWCLLVPSLTSGLTVPAFIVTTPLIQWCFVSASKCRTCPGTLLWKPQCVRHRCRR